MLWAWVIHSEPCHLVPGLLVQGPGGNSTQPCLASCLPSFLSMDRVVWGRRRWCICSLYLGVGLAWFSQLTGLAWGAWDAGGADILAQTISRATETTGKVEQKQSNAWLYTLVFKTWFICLTEVYCDHSKTATYKSKWSCHGVDSRLVFTHT